MGGGGGGGGGRKQILKKKKDWEKGIFFHSFALQEKK